tara:strand:- start:2213 stop:2431 length:219 start_codon:yes stop_codon:yes gene_type:complete
MKPVQILRDLRELQEIWRKNNFQYTKEQRALYDKLTQLRYQRVRFFYDNNLVFKGSKAAADKASELEENQQS